LCGAQKLTTNDYCVFERPEGHVEGTRLERLVVHIFRWGPARQRLHACRPDSLASVLFILQATGCLLLDFGAQLLQPACMHAQRPARPSGMAGMA
jgi:hypothetical protein